MIESTVYDRLRNDAAIAAIVGDRIYPELADDDAHSAGPYLVYTLVGGLRPLSVQLEAAQKSARFQFDCYASGKQLVKNLKEAVIQLFQGVGFSLGGVDVQYAALDSEPVPSLESATNQRRIMIEFTFHYN